MIRLLGSSWITFKVQEKKKKVIVLFSHPWQNVKLASLTLYIHATTAEKRTKKHDARAELIAFSGALAREARHAAGHHGLENEVIYPSEKMANG